MEKLPPFLENKIFYYLRHPIAEALINQEVVILNNKDSTHPHPTSFFEVTFIYFLPEKLGMKCDRGLYKKDSGVTPNFQYSWNNNRPCYASPAYLIHYKLRKYIGGKILVENNKQQIERMMLEFRILGRGRVRHNKYIFEVSDEVEMSSFDKNNSYLELHTYNLVSSGFSYEFYEKTSKRVKL